ncbi:MAG: MopE-related protein [Myxococcales bacterium]
MQSSLWFRQVCLVQCCAILWLVGCSKSDDKTAELTGEEAAPDCDAGTCAANQPATDWSAQQPVYSAQLKLVDEGGKAIANAHVEVENLATTTNADGRAVIGPIDAGSSAKIKASSDGKVPHVGKTDVSKSGQKNQQITLLPLSTSKEVDAQQAIVVTDDKARVDVKANALTRKDGTRPDKAKLEIASQHPADLPESARVGSPEAFTRLGTPSFLKQIFTLAYVRFTDLAGQELNLVAGQPAQLALRLPSQASAKVGDTMPLWYLDEEKVQWQEQGSCKVSQRMLNGQAVRFCEGLVAHFSYWAIADAVDIEQPNQMGCFKMTSSLTDTGCDHYEIEGWILGGCDAQGQACVSVDYAFPFVRGAGQPEFCAVTPIYPTYRLTVLYDHQIKSDGTCSTKKVTTKNTGHKIKVSDPFSLASFQSTLASKFMLGFVYNQQRDCDELCTQVSITLSGDDGSWTDQDDDGSFKIYDNAGSVYGLLTDCNDADPAVHPGQVEVFCTTGDANCDGVMGAGAKSQAGVDASSWNSWCAWCQANAGPIQTSPEVAGNDFDEDCMGGLSDRDGDGVEAPADCDDLDPGANPNLPEVAGNYADENCDAFVADADDDGWYAASDKPRAEELQLDSTQFRDCNDYDSATNPGANPMDEAGSLGTYYYRTTNGETRRSANFCFLFDGDGQPTGQFYDVVGDLNCDGFRTDMDGDGLTATGDVTLDTPDKVVSIDCDDRDPRVGAAENGTCPAPQPATANDRDCAVRTPKCAPMSVSSTVVTPICSDTTDNNMQLTGMGVCAYPSWPEGNPLAIEPGKVWGPCDGADPALPECPSNSLCLGPLSYTPEFTAYMEANYTNGAKLFFQGMCFPNCQL